MSYNKYELDKAEIVCHEILLEVKRAKNLFPNNFVNQHEAYGVLTEEYKELETEIFKNQKNYDLDNQRKEATQLAAMCVRLITELL